MDTAVQDITTAVGRGQNRSVPNPLLIMVVVAFGLGAAPTPWLGIASSAFQLCFRLLHPLGSFLNTGDEVSAPLQLTAVFRNSKQVIDRARQLSISLTAAGAFRTQYGCCY